MAGVLKNIRDPDPTLILKPYVVPQTLLGVNTEYNPVVNSAHVGIQPKDKAKQTKSQSLEIKFSILKKN